MTERNPFIAYWKQVDDDLKRLFDRDTAEAGIGAESIRTGYLHGWTPEQCARRAGARHHLTAMHGGLQ